MGDLKKVEDEKFSLPGTNPYLELITGRSWSAGTLSQKEKARRVFIERLRHDFEMKAFTLKQQDHIISLDGLKHFKTWTDSYQTFDETIQVGDTKIYPAM